jgi:hypothetical protein
MKKKLYIAIPMLLMLLAATLVMGYRSAWEKLRRMDCQSQLKMVCVGLLLYARENDGYYPDKDGDEGLRMLWDGGYVTHPYTMCCPSVQPSKEYSIEYDYVAGYRTDSDKDIGIVMDKVGNHRDYGNIGFVDLSVQQFAGKEWRRNADPH